MVPFVWAALRLKDILLSGTMRGVRRVRCSSAPQLSESGAETDVRGPGPRIPLHRAATAGAAGGKRRQSTEMKVEMTGQR